MLLRLGCWEVGLPRLRLDGGAARPRAENVALERCLRRAVLVRSSAVRIPRVTTTKAAPLDGDGFAFVASLLRGRWAFYSSGRLGGTAGSLDKRRTSPQPIELREQDVAARTHGQTTPRGVKFEAL